VVNHFLSHGRFSTLLSVRILSRLHLTELSSSALAGLVSRIAVSSEGPTRCFHNVAPDYLEFLKQHPASQADFILGAAINRRPGHVYALEVRQQMALSVFGVAKESYF